MDLKKILAQGADERIFIDNEGKTKYGAKLINPDVINRGSCTCNPAQIEDIELMKEALSDNKTNQDWIALQERVSQKIRKGITGESKKSFEIFYAPSGTDLLYLPLLFARLTHPGQNILNLITCVEELGSGTELAACEKFYSDYNQFGEDVGKGNKIIDGGILETVFLRARTDSGEIINNEAQIERLVNTHSKDLIIINLVYGSKSGIEDNLSLIDKFNAPNIMWNVDLCQFRHGSEIINMLIEKGATVMITGSKFYQSCPFSGAMLVPNAMYNEVANVQDWNPVQAYSKVFCKHDFPLELHGVLPFTKKVNISLILRWLCASEEMERYNQIPKKLAEQTINSWVKVILEEIHRRPEFELMPFQENTNQTIISFRLKVGDTFMSHQDLKEIHSIIATESYEDRVGIKNIFIGQPVAYANKSFLRLAIGSKNVRSFIEKEEKSFQTDRTIIDIIQEKLYQYYENKY